MLKRFIYTLLLLTGFSLPLSAKTIFIILPIEHQALDEILCGFQTELRAQMGGEKIEFVVKNALGDLNIQRTIIQQAKALEPDLIVPIGTQTAQMTAAMIKDIPIIATASLPIQGKNVTGVNDEISVANSYHLMKLVLRSLKEVTVLYTPQEKNFESLKELKTLTEKDQISLDEILIPNLTDLYANSQAIQKQSNVLFIFKDNLIASGVSVLIHQARAKQIPLMTSDEATVQKGACFALGVREKAIGEQAAHLASHLLNGKSIHELPFETMKQLSIFRNKKACEMQGLNPQYIQEAAKTLHYNLVDEN